MSRRRLAGVIRRMTNIRRKAQKPLFRPTLLTACRCLPSLGRCLHHRQSATARWRALSAAPNSPTKPRRSRKQTHFCSLKLTRLMRGDLPGKGSRGPWNKCGGFIAAFMPRKPLDPLDGKYARGSAGDGVLHPRRLPHGECGVWGSAPGFAAGGLSRLTSLVPAALKFVANLVLWVKADPAHAAKGHRCVS